MFRLRYRPKAESEGLIASRQRQNGRKRNGGMKRRRRRLNSVNMAGFDVLLAAAMRSRHLHAAALAVHAPAAGMF
jgi:hypothetical protein